MGVLVFILTLLPMAEDLLKNTEHDLSDIGLLAVAHGPGSFTGIRIGVSKLRKTQKEDTPEDNAEGNEYGYITVIENVFHYKQVIPLQMGVNTIGRYMKNSGVNCAIETNDPSIDINHCTITVSRDKNGSLKYILKDGPSYTGTFVDNVILGDREQRRIEDGTLFTIGATSIILHAPKAE